MFKENQKRNLTDTLNPKITNQPEMEKEAVNQKPKVLIVDDEEDFAITLKDILELKGYQADIANDGKQALQFISGPRSGCNGRYDISLVDLNLPDIRGLELIQSFKLYSPETEVIVITGNPSLPTAVKALNAGAFGYIEKPYNIDRLFIILERALERQRLIKVLQESETRYRRLFEEFGAAIFILNLKNIGISHPNKAFTKLFGYSETELPVLSFKDFFFLEDYPRLDQRLERLQLEGTVSLETQLRRKGNTPFWAEIHLTLLDSRTRTGEPSEPVALTLILDLTKRKEAEADLLKTKSYLETIFTGIGSGVAIIDLNYTILDANPAYCKLMGTSLKEAIGKKCYELHHGQKMPCANSGEICPIQNCRASGVSSHVYHEHHAQDGAMRSRQGPPGAESRYLEITVTPLKDEYGNLISFISVQNDLTEIRKANKDLETKSRELEMLNQELIGQREKLLGTADELERANTELIKMSAAKSEFVSAVSHELRTPLTAIMEGISLVEDGSLGSVNTDQQRFLVLAKNNSKRLADLINDLLDLSKIEAGRFDIIPTKLDLEKTIRELVQTLGPLVKEKRLTLKLELPTGLKPVFVDERSLFRVLMNLLSNAVKFTPAGGTITIGAEISKANQPTRDKVGTGDRILENSPQPSSLTEHQSRATSPECLKHISALPQAVISVKDTGAGIPKDQQYKLFGKFQQITLQGTPRPTGTGLGLALSKELVELNQGKIWVESDEGAGSKFSFSLPVYEEYEDLKQTFVAMVKDCHQASVPIVIYLFKVLPGLQAISQKQLTAVLDAVEKVVKSRTTRFDMLRRDSNQSSIVALSPAHEANTKTNYNQILDFLRGTTFLVDNHEIDVKLVSCYHVINHTDNFSIDQALSICNAKLEEVR
jgi:PAS domain S-box-containing protein